MADRFVPREDQAEMIRFALSTPGALLCAEPGSGKTVVGLTVAEHLLHHEFDSGIDRVLICAPKIVAEETWKREIAQWEHLRHLKVRVLTAEDFEYRQRIEWHCADEHGAQRVIVDRDATPDDRAYLARLARPVWRVLDESLTDLVAIDPETATDAEKVLLAKRQAEGIAQEGTLGTVLRKVVLEATSPAEARARILAYPERIVTISRDHLAMLAKLMGRRWPYGFVIPDESTSYANPKSNRSIALRAMRKFGRIKRVLMLTGTPMPRSAEQLHAQMLVVDGGERLGGPRELTKFRNRFMEPDARNQDRIFSYRLRPDMKAALWAAVADVAMSVKSDGWRKVGEARIVERKVKLPPEARDYYDEMERENLIVIDEEVVAVNAAVVSSKLLQIASGTVKGVSGKGNPVHEVKLDYVAALVEEIDAPVVIVYWWAESLPRLKKRFRKGRSIKEEGALDGFIKGKFDVLFLHPQSAGHGVNGLQWRSHRMIVLDPFHSWEYAQQTIARLDRSGQETQVVVDVIEAEDTLDELIPGIWRAREEDQGAMMNALLWRRRKAVAARSGGGVLQG